MYLTVKEASELTGKSPTTIYRLCNKRRNSLYVRKEDNKFFIDKTFLLATYPQNEAKISHEIEHGSLEVNEPVFLEIEPKKEEVSLVQENVETIEKVETGDDIAPQLQNSDIKKTLETIEQEINIPEEKESKAISETLQNIAEPIDGKAELKGKFIGLSVCIMVLVALIMLLYYFGK